MQTEKAPRGRPKTLDREHVIQTALLSYWADGPLAVSINEICRRAGISKPGLYREFESEDGLKCAVITAYHEQFSAQVAAALQNKTSLAQQLDVLTTLLLQEKKKAGMPVGCLQVAMDNCTEQLGVQAAQKVTEIKQQTLKQYEHWIKQAKRSGELNSTISARVGALYIDEQISSALLQQKRGVPVKDTKVMLRLALSVLV